MAGGARSYRQPRRLNPVSVTLLVFVALVGYLGYVGWPVIALHANVRSAMEDALPKLYRANLLPDTEAAIAADETRRVLLEKLAALGLANAESVLTMTRDSKTVAIAVRVDTALDLKIAGKKVPLTLNPRVETSAARVSY